MLYGTPGTGKTEFASTLAKELNIDIYGVGECDEDDDELSRNERIQALNFTQKLMKNHKKTILLFDEAEDLFNDYSPIFGRTSKSSKVYINRFLENNKLPIIWTTNSVSRIDPAYIRRFSYVIEFKIPPKKTLVSMWKKKLSCFNFSNNEVKEIYSAYPNMTPAAIDSVCNSAKSINADLKLFNNILDNIMKAITGKEPTKKKQNKKVNFNYNILNTDTDLKQLSNRITKKNVMNFSLCLYGVPGTGKSEYAKELGKKLGIEVIYKKASDLLGMYVGESEKNIARAFEEAKEQEAMLIFDEADSFLQNRENATKSWEISQVNEMLTWMESHKYPFVCTTNLMSSLDKASLRRFTFKVKYDYLKPQQVKTAFKHFFDFIPKKTQHLVYLTPGDFEVVKNKAQILDILDDKKEIINMLSLEMNVKNNTTLKKKIGF